MPSWGIWGSSLAVATLLLLGGCSIQPGSGLSASQAREQFYSALNETQQAAGGGTWEVLDDPTARGCVIPIWFEGSKFPGFRIGPAPRNPATTANTVYALWTGLGYAVSRSRIGPVIEVQARSAKGELFIFRASEHAVTLQGESECRPL